MTCRSLLAAAAAMTTLACSSVPAAAADQVEIVLTGAISARGLGGNDVCRVHMKMKNRTAFRLEKLTFALHFPDLATPTLGGTGIVFLSPDSLGSDQEDQFVATWHQGRCQAAHYQQPTFSADTCVVGALSERDCKALFALRSEIRKPSAFFSPADLEAVGPALDDKNMQGMDCARLAGLEAKLRVAYRTVGVSVSESVWPLKTSTGEVLIDRGAGLHRYDSSSGILEVRSTNGFNTLFTYSAGNPKQRLHKLDRSIDVSDPKYNLPGQYTYRVTKSGPATATAKVTRIVTDLGTQKVGSCTLRAVFVEEKTDEDTGRVHEEAAYVWYPDLKLRLDRFAKGQYEDGKGLLPLDPRYVNFVNGFHLMSVKIAE